MDRPRDIVPRHLRTLVEALEPDTAVRVSLAEPERRLMVALLTDAIVCFRKLAASARRDERRLLHEAREWFRSDDRAWPGSFVNVCDAIGLEPDPLRRAVLSLESAPDTARNVRRRIVTGSVKRAPAARRRHRS